MNAVDSPQAIPFSQTSSRTSRGARTGWSACIDGYFLFAVVSILLIGLTMVASASVAIADKSGSPLGLFWRQSVYLGVATGIVTVLWPLELKFWHRAGGLLMLGSVALLALVLVPGIGREVNGATRWLSLGVVNLQPSEFGKIFVVMYLAGYLVRRAQEVRSAFSGFFKPVLILVVIAWLLLLEPDFGATVVVFATSLAMLFLGGAPLRIFFGWVAVTAVALGGILMAAPYRLQRLFTFLDPWADPFNSGFQLAQALIAIGRGEWFGVGLGGSVQKLFYLPEAHTDFLFAVLAEEFGLTGMTVVLALFGLLIWRGFSIASEAHAKGNEFGAYLAQGLTLLIGIQAFFNIGVNVGVLPTKGLTLPLMSFGGSSLLASAFAAGLILRIGYEARRAP